MILFFNICLNMGMMILGLLISVAYLTYFERKMIASIQLRKGPNIVGFLGVLQPIADAIKLIHKQHIFSSPSNKFLFLLSPFIMIIFALGLWAVVPFNHGHVWSDLNMGILYIMAIFGLSSYGIFCAGWSSKSKYSFLGSIRALAQFISYELVIGFILLAIVLWTGSFNLSAIVLAQKNLWFVVPLFPFFVVFFMASLVASYRLPFDLPEAETELVAGYHVEYSSLLWGFFFLGEYLHLLFFTAFTTILFLGGWHSPFSFGIFVSGPLWFFLKMSILLFIIIWIRASLPRLRYNHVIALCWKILIPGLLGGISLIALMKKIFYL